MQITPVPLPAVAAAVPQQQTVTNGLHNVQVQAVQPITQGALAPTPETYKGDRTKEKKDRSGREKKQGSGEKQRGENVNISV